jgi:protease-4
MIENRYSSSELRSRFSRLWVIWIVVPLVAGYFLATWLIPAPKIGVIPLEGDIYDELADYVVEQLNYARNDPSIRAVVLKVNSPGGGVTASENLYYSILSFREHKPLVVSIDTLAASGGYYAASAGEVIYAKPSSSIGNVGVVSLLPTPTFVDEELIATGPYKLFGSTRSGYVRELEILKQGFLEAVLAQRGERLEIDKEELARGEVYVGILAQDKGLIDSLGTLNDAIDKAAALAKVANYQTFDLETIPGLEPPEPPPFTFRGDDLTTPESEGRRLLPPGLYYLTFGESEVIL